ncbi:hypothetical protein SAMN05421882_11304 [Nitrosomonas communis]|uniref:Uncharacterized protein n=1 Tax=Nitrosomonas communis TaxID=44574 RepID=A0A1H3ACQ1_9PROT|nr:hypothetical protein SAMN05421882_11304 [Nitrosomonas communis]
MLYIEVTDVTHAAEKKLIILIMKKEKLELYTDYLISNNGYATATGLSSMLDGEISHDQVTRFLSEEELHLERLMAAG